MSDAHPAEQAVRAFWTARAGAAAKQVAAGKADAGTRGAVTAGRHLAALEDIVAAEFVTAGFDPTSVRRKNGIELPGYYRPAKKWDIVVVEDGHLVAASEPDDELSFAAFASKVAERAAEIQALRSTRGLPG